MKFSLKDVFVTLFFLGIALAHLGQAYNYQRQLDELARQNEITRRFAYDTFKVAIGSLPNPGSPEERLDKHLRETR
jgi:hypothetical protein